MSAPYARRERRANIGACPEAYPGQHERVLAMIEAHDAELAARERELAAEARAGGRALTHPAQAQPTESELRALWGDR